MCRDRVVKKRRGYRVKQGETGKRKTSGDDRMQITNKIKMRKEKFYGKTRLDKKT